MDYSTKRALRLAGDYGPEAQASAEAAATAYPVRHMPVGGLPIQIIERDGKFYAGPDGPEVFLPAGFVRTTTPTAAPAAAAQTPLATAGHRARRASSGTRAKPRQGSR